MLLPILDSRSPDAISDCAALRFDQTFFLPSLLHVEDRMCMAHSIESRVPFLDPTLIRLVRAIPDGLFPRTTLGKELLRAAMVEVVPDSVLRRNKQPFRVPESSWYSGELHPWLTRKLLSADSALLELFNRGWLEQLVASHRQKRVNRKSLLWGLVCLEEWFNVFL
jgi:asparagine synthase (glutamine-hydrolysing)